MITLTLLHPVQSTPVQSWTFEHEPIIRIGRSTDNHVILYSAVVSRHHVELRQVNSHWEIFNLGTNGMYVNGKQVMQAVVEDGVVIRLARSGPNVQIHLKAVSAEGFAGETTLAQRIRSKMASATTDPTAKEPIEATEPTTSLPLT
ncbi:FHA domain-containing protein, partial [Leptolyngbya sp. FACHB-36]|uniref:FHA domain-containing protein n=1 Tax=Leptolyngbya sp. FACHB-36 TaxID=2692808 RepID=UPI001680BB38|nr:FHA domain-containing protein [Leptolyngbya sp. FACHB-36]